ncbi:hypothetical protein Tco_0778626 [Tanacetum coccineum]
MKSNTAFTLFLVVLFALVLTSFATRTYPSQTNNPKGIRRNLLCFKFNHLFNLRTVVEAQKGFHTDGGAGGWGGWINNGQRNNDVGLNGKGGGN